MTENIFPSLATREAEPAARAVNWRHVGAFLALAFGLTWLLDLGIYLKGGLNNPATGAALQFQMLLPAFSALLLGVFFFKDSPVYYRTLKTAARWFIAFYLLLTLVFAVLVGYLLSLPDSQVTMAATNLSPVLLLAAVAGLVVLVVMRLIGGKGTYEQAGMAGGRAIYWLVLGVGLVLFYFLGALLNYLFKLGTPADPSALLPAGSAEMMSPVVLRLALAFNTVVVGPFLGLVISFGEEYGWRGFLQSELNHLGRIRGTFLLGIIWGIWHWPVIWMGYNYPGEPVWGSLFMVGYCIILAYFLAYAVFKSKGLWTAVYLHALNNQAAAFTVMALVAPGSALFAFPVGLPGLALGALVVLLLLRDPIWQEQ